MVNRKMKRNTCKFNLSILFIALAIISITSSTKWQTDQQQSDSWVANRFVDDFEEATFCNSEDDKKCQTLIPELTKLSLMKRKNIEKYPITYIDSLPEENIKSNLPVPHSLYNRVCSCGLKPRIADLGYAYFPRYISTGVCRSDGCRGGTFKCRPKTYKLVVLRRKEVAEVEREQRELSFSIPESIKDVWNAETVTVNVACECRP